MLYIFCIPFEWLKIREEVKFMLIDTHAHLNDERYEGKLEELMEQLKEEKVILIINPSVDLETSHTSIDLAEKFDFIYAAVGYHPHEAKDASDRDFHEIKKLTSHKKVVAIGEIGLDYYYDHSPKGVQKEVFEKQIVMAKEYKLPVIVHSREAHLDTFNLLQANREGLDAVLHSYSGSWEMAKRYLDLGFYLSISGPITFKNAQKLPEIAVNVPLDRLLIETDSPYLTPVPFRGKTNNPIYVKYVAQRICELRNISLELLLEHVKENTLNLFSKINLENAHKGV